MRTIGSFDSETAASRFGDILYMEGIESHTDLEEDGKFTVWIIDEEQVRRGGELLERFRVNPDAPEFRDAPTRARRQRSLEEKAESARQSTVADTARIGYERDFRGLAYLPLLLVVLCVTVAIYSRLGEDRRALQQLQISNYVRSPTNGAWEHMITRQRGVFLAEVRAGQIWRLFTPILIHYGLLHLVFNMFMLRDLGTFVENRFGAAYFAGLVGVVAVLSNVAQFAWVGAPNFGGMSGVVYGLFGFLWMRGRFDRHAAWQLSSTTVQILLVWYVLCLTNLFANVVGPVANTVHTVGLLVGMGWGFLTATR